MESNANFGLSVVTEGCVVTVCLRHCKLLIHSKQHTPGRRRWLLVTVLYSVTLTGRMTWSRHPAARAMVIAARLLYKHPARRRFRWLLFTNFVDGPLTLSSAVRRALCAVAGDESALSVQMTACHALFCWAIGRKMITFSDELILQHTSLPSHCLLSLDCLYVRPRLNHQ